MIFAGNLVFDDNLKLNCCYEYITDFSVVRDSSLASYPINIHYNQNIVFKYLGKLIKINRWETSDGPILELEFKDLGGNIREIDNNEKFFLRKTDCPIDKEEEEERRMEERRKEERRMEERRKEERRMEERRMEERRMEERRMEERRRIEEIRRIEEGDDKGIEMTRTIKKGGKTRKSKSKKYRKSRKLRKTKSRKSNAFMRFFTRGSAGGKK